MTVDRTLGLWWRRRGIQSRSTILATVVAFISALVLGVMTMVLVRVALDSSAQQAAALRAQDFAAQYASDVDSTKTEISAETNDGVLLQVFTQSGQVLAKSTSLNGYRPLTWFLNPGSQMYSEIKSTGLPDSFQYQIVAISAHSSSGPVTVVAAVSLEERDHTLHILLLALLGILPVALLLVALSTWLTVGRSLRIVNEIREQVEIIEANNISSRVPIPESTDEIAQLAHTMNTTLEMLEKSSVRQRQFVADASHELKSPLSSIRVALDISQLEGRPLDSAEFDRVSNEVDRMATLVSDLLILTRSDERLSDPHFVQVDLDDLIVKQVQRLRQESSLDIVANIEPVQVRGDKNQLDRICRNIADNARNFAFGTIRLTLRKVDASLALILIEDDGPGIPEKYREKVFERFSRLDAQRSRNTGGTGLGLAIVRDLVNAHGGRVSVGTSELGGASFQVLIPCNGQVAPIEVTHA